MVLINGIYDISIASSNHTTILGNKNDVERVRSHH